MRTAGKAFTSCKGSAFTLVELLFVISIIALLAALLFPVYSSVRGKARQTSCTSNLRQIGMAIAQYAQDADDLYPLASDTASPSALLWTGLMDASPVQKAAFNASRPLKTVITPYLKNSGVWRCPSDGGACGWLPRFTTVAFMAPVEFCSEVYESLGTSYFYRAQLGVDGVRHPASGLNYGNPPQELGSSEIGVLTDGIARWHGDSGADKSVDSGWDRHNMLFADGHVKVVNDSGFVRAWMFEVKTPS